MKKVNAKITLLALASVLTLGTLTTSCSKDDDNGHEQPAQGTIDAAVGTYKGKLSSSNTYNRYEWYDAIVIV
ncbi:MAG TPA: hypothetical protein VNJ50_03785, partial [Gelidibacter sp.]|nr:hypothetical protein [Gelidibacter sp.]